MNQNTINKNQNTINKNQKTKNKNKKILNWNKAWYYMDEFIVLVFAILGVLASHAVMKRTRGQSITLNDIFSDWVNFAISALLAIVSYGSMYTKVRYNDDAKPPFIKRAAAAFLQGVAYRSVISWTQ